MTRIPPFPACLASGLLLVAAGHGSVLVVDSTADRPDLLPGDGNCVAAVGSPPVVELRCTLRAAVQEANAAPGQDVIRLPVGIFHLTRQGEEPWYALDVRVGDLDVTDDLEVVGEGEGTVVAGAGMGAQAARGSEEPGHRIFDIEGAAVTLKHLEIQDGSSQHGGCLRSVNASLTLDGVVIRGCTATSGFGGGVLAETFPCRAGGLVIRNSLIIDNLGLSGGGVSASWGNCPLFRLHVEASSIVRNRALADGGGLFVVDPFDSSSLSMVNATVSSNRAGRHGGGMYLEVDASFIHVTLFDNRAGREGGGLSTGFARSTQKVELGDSILWRNRSGEATRGPDCPDCPDCDAELAASIFSRGNNFVGIACPGFAAHPSDRIGVNPQLLALGLYGSRLPTHPPAPGGAATDAGASGRIGRGCPGTAGGPVDRDQRGSIRPVDGDADGDTRCDPGAVELQVADTLLVISLQDFEGGDLGEWDGVSPPPLDP